MNTGKTVFTQLQKHLPLHQFRRCVKRYGGNHKVQSFTCLDQYLCLFFAQLTYRESLRNITTCLLGMQNKLYHMGLRRTIARSTLADANENRDWRIYQDFAHILIYVFLCFHGQNSVHTNKLLSMHKLLDLRDNIPSFIVITNSKVHDVNIHLKLSY